MTPRAKDVRDCGYLLTYTASKDWSLFHGHRIGGDAGPRAIPCPNCDLPMLRMFLLSGSDPFVARSLGLRDGVDFDVQFCWRCEASQDWLQYRLRPGERPEIASVRIGGLIKDFPYPDYPAFFPEGVVQPVPLPDGAVDAEGRWLDHPHDDDAPSGFSVEDGPRHQFLGRMFRWDEEQDAICVGCGEPMRLVMTVADHNLHPLGMAGYIGAMLAVHWCAACQMIGIRQQVD